MSVHSSACQFSCAKERTGSIGSRALLRQAIREIKDGSFAAERAQGIKAGLPEFRKLHQQAADFEISRAEEKSVGFFNNISPRTL